MKKKIKWVVYNTNYCDDTSSSCNVLDTKKQAKSLVASFVKKMRTDFRNSPEYRKGDKLPIKKWFDNANGLGIGIADSSHLYATIVMHHVEING